MLQKRSNLTCLDDYRSITSMYEYQWAMKSEVNLLAKFSEICFYKESEKDDRLQI